MDVNSSLLVGGVFKLELFLPQDYPMVPPKVCVEEYHQYYSRCPEILSRMTYLMCPLVPGPLSDEDLPSECG